MMTGTSWKQAIHVKNEMLNERDEQIKKLQIDLAVALSTITDLRKLAYERWPKMAMEANASTLERAEKAESELARLTIELTYIANAKHGSIECEFRAWAQNRARHALNQQPGTLTVKKEKA